MLQPKRTKFRKQHKGRNTGVATSGTQVSFGEYGLKCTTRGMLTARQIEAARRAINRYIKRGGKVWIRIFPDKPITKKRGEGIASSMWFGGGRGEGEREGERRILGRQNQARAGVV